MIEKESRVKDCNKINLYQNRDSRNYIEEGEPRALYWYKYREVYSLLRESLQPGKKISPIIQLYNDLPSDIPITKYPLDLEENIFEIPIVYMGNNFLSPFSFDIKKKDRSTLLGIEYPGISATIAFSENISETCGAIFDRDCKRQDRMYCIPISKIEECNYSVYYLPTENMPLHVRLVHNIHRINLQEHLPPFNDRKLLANAFMEGRMN